MRRHWETCKLNKNLSKPHINKGDRDMETLETLLSLIYKKKEYIIYIVYIAQIYYS